MKYHGVMFIPSTGSNVCLLTWVENDKKYLCTGITSDPDGAIWTEEEIRHTFDTNRWIKVCDLKEVMSKYYVKD